MRKYCLRRVGCNWWLRKFSKTKFPAGKGVCKSILIVIWIFFGHCQCLLLSVRFIPGPFPTSVNVQPDVVNQRAVRTILKRMSELQSNCIIVTYLQFTSRKIPSVIQWFSLLYKLPLKADTRRKSPNTHYSVTHDTLLSFKKYNKMYCTLNTISGECKWLIYMYTNDVVYLQSLFCGSCFTAVGWPSFSARCLDVCSSLSD